MGFAHAVIAAPASGRLFVVSVDMFNRRFRRVSGASNDIGARFRPVGCTRSETAMLIAGRNITASGEMVMRMRRRNCGVKQLLSLQDNLFLTLLRPNQALHKTALPPTQAIPVVKVSRRFKSLWSRPFYEHCNHLA
ncbi:hypothetical protein [Burkholderia cepacia]|uniref:hypothetical protein n=1 Tax=Burkholderia cepacia TaxID=292 RepID=UPI00128D0C37|nr:hypothetical protein [Burkholderia cepacia]